MTGVVAAPKRRRSDGSPSTTGLKVKCEPPAKAKPAKTSMAMAASLRIISTDCVSLPLRTPRQLMKVRRARVTRARSHCGMAAPVSSTA